MNQREEINKSQSLGGGSASVKVMATLAQKQNRQYKVNSSSTDLT